MNLKNQPTNQPTNQLIFSETCGDGLIGDGDDLDANETGDLASEKSRQRSMGAVKTNDSTGSHSPDTWLRHSVLRCYALRQRVLPGAGSGMGYGSHDSQARLK